VPVVNRWTLYDPATTESWEFPRNPNRMTSPHPPKNTTIFARTHGHPETSPDGGMSRVIQFRQTPYEWSFSGDIRTQEHYETFLVWTTKTGLLTITDHFNRVWSIRIDSVELEEQRPSANKAYKFRYTVRAAIYGRVS
jgi:hypothetical protein